MFLFLLLFAPFHLLHPLSRVPSVCFGFVKEDAATRLTFIFIYYFITFLSIEYNFWLLKTHTERVILEYSRR